MKYILLGFAFSFALRLAAGLSGKQYWIALACGLGLVAGYELLEQYDEYRASRSGGGE